MSRTPQQGRAGADGDASDSWVERYVPHGCHEMPYRLMKPICFDSNKRYPVIVALHGGFGRGTDNRKQLLPSGLAPNGLRVSPTSIMKLLADEQRRTAHPSYVLAPQVARLWGGRDLHGIKEIVAKLPSVDMDRIYVLGHSMGGHGTHIFIRSDPGYFAAAAPSAGTGLPHSKEFIDASAIKDIPIWAFHGDQDERCPIERERQLFAEMERLRGNTKLTIWAGDGHGVASKMIAGGDNGSTRFSSDRCDPEPVFLKWLFAQKRSHYPKSNAQV